MMRRLLVGLGLFLAIAIATPAAAQVKGWRFEITRTDDSTFVFPRLTANWVRPGQTGIAVDPRRHDALVARFRIVSVDSGRATALVTGQTTRVVVDHVAILEEPRRPWFRTVLFWGGVALGAVVGAVAGSQF